MFGEHSEEIAKIAREIREQYYQAPFSVGDRVNHPSGRMVEITSGQFWGTYGLSNFWHWREVLPDGSLSDKDEHGYGWAPGEAE